MNDDSSDSNSSVEHVLMNYKNKVKEDFISNSLSIESSSKKSNINININMPSTSENATFLFSVEHGPMNNKHNSKKISKKTNLNVETNDELKNNRKNKKTPKSAGGKFPKRFKNNTSDQTSEDPDYKPSAERNYINLTTKQLNSIAKRVHIYHETGIVVSDDEDVDESQNKHKNRNIKNQSRRQLEQVPGTYFGQGRVGTFSGSYGIQKYGCFNVPKNNSLLNLCSSHSNIQLPKEVLDTIKHREERLLQVQQKQLLQHPELAGIGDDDNDDEQQIEIPEFSEDKRAWVQKFIDSMSADRIDYDKPKQANFVEAIEQKRPSIVVPKDNDDLINSIDNKTIVERIDFKKRQSTIDEWLKYRSAKKTQNNLPIATSTPRHAINPHLSDTDISNIAGPSKVNTNLTTDDNNTLLTNKIQMNRQEVSSKVKTNIFKDVNPSVTVTTNIEEPLDDISTDISHLDRSNITLRTPHSKSTGIKNNPSVSEPIIEEKDDIMDFVDNLLSKEAEMINQEVNERCEKWLEDNRRTQDILRNALDSVIVVNDDDIPHNDSVEIISQCPEDTQADSVVNDSIVVIEDDNSIIPIINISDNTIPSTSRNTRGRRRRQPTRRCRRNQTRSAPKQSSILIEPVAPILSTVQLAKGPENKGLRDCSICLENMENKEISATICGHIFCTPCITAAIRSNRSCPNCRAALTLKKIHPLFI